MRHVRLTVRPAGEAVEVPEMYRVLSNAPYLERVVGLHWNVSGDRLGLMVYGTGDVEAFREALQTVPTVLDFEVLAAGDGFYAYLQNELNELSRELFGTFTRGSLLVLPPLEYGGDGSVTISVFGPLGEVQAAIEEVPAPFEVTIGEVTGMGATPGLVGTLLSPRQREAVEVAIEVGYYDVPRVGDHEAIAARMGCAPSTAAEHLRKAESKVIRAAFPAE